ncbi:Ig-like domain-containing protein, partial [Pseudomonas citronellolis]
VSGNVLGGTGAGAGDVADSDPDGDTLSVTTFEVNGTTHNAGDSVTIAGIGDLTLNADGSYTFIPAQDWNGTVPAVTYFISDGEGGTSSAELNITVTSVNDPPQAQGFTIIGQNNDDADSIANLDVSGYFHDADGDTLTYSASGLPNGLSIDPNTGVISGTIDHSASQDGTGGVHSVTVTATDGDGESVDRVFTWTVTNPSPVAHDDSATTSEDTAVSGNVLGGTGAGAGDVADSDPDGDTLSVTTFEVNGTTHNAGDSVTIAGIGDLTLNA